MEEISIFSGYFQAYFIHVWLKAEREHIWYGWKLQKDYLMGLVVRQLQHCLCFVSKAGLCKLAPPININEIVSS